jgi:DNA polymerase elongation subunit (family B)
MYSYKSKNYALLDDKGRVHVAGAALKSRGMEPFLRNYISRHLEMLLQGRAQDIPALYEEYVQKLQEHQLPLADLAKREYLSQAPDKYLEQVKTGKSKRSAALELAATAKRVYKMGDPVQYFVTGNKKSVSVVENSRLLEQADPAVRDENVPYYLDKLKQIHEKLL